MNQYTNHYAQIDTESAIHNASPHQVIKLLMQGFLTNINKAKASIQAGDINAKNHFIHKARDIIYGLLEALNLEEGGELAQNLQMLYEYITRRLSEANLHNSIDMLDEVAGLLREIKTGWDAIPEKLDDHS